MPIVELVSLGTVKISNDKGESIEVDIETICTIVDEIRARLSAIINDES